MLIRSVISLCSRMILAAILMTHVVLGVAGFSGPLAPSNSPLFLETSGGLPLHALAHALTFVAAIWVLFGIQTRIAAIVGLVAYGLCLRAELSSPGLALADLAALALPLGVGLIVCMIGGGRFSIYRDDWRQIL